MAEMRALAAERGINLRDLMASQMPNKDAQINKGNETNAKEFAKALGEEEGKGSATYRGQQGSRDDERGAAECHDILPHL